MDQQITQVIGGMVNDCLSSPAFGNLPEDQKQSLAEQIRKHLYTQILFTVIDNLTDEQFAQIQGLQPDNPLLQQKIEEFTSTMPYLLNDIEDKLKADVEYIKQNGQLPPQPEQQ